MKKLFFSGSPALDTALLIKDKLVFSTPEQKQVYATNYFIPISSQIGTKINSRVVVLGTYHPSTGNVKKKDVVTFSEELLDYCQTIGITTLLVADSTYFKYMTGMKSVEKHIGEKFDCVVPTYGEISIVPVLNYTSLGMFPEKKALQDKALSVAADVMSGTFEGKTAFEFNSYKVLKEPQELLELLKFDGLSVDIETTGLRFERDKILTIAFSWTDKDAVSIPIHYRFHDDATEKAWVSALRDFFIKYTGNLYFHNGLFDVKFLIRTLFMKDALDYHGRSYGAKVLNFDDTMIMAYACLNSTSRPSLSLKDLSYTYVGDYAVDVKDLTVALDTNMISVDELLLYNAYDTVATFWLYEKFSKLLVEEDQLSTYHEILQPSLNYLVQMMLNGLPISVDTVSKARDAITMEYNKAVSTLAGNMYVKQTVKQLRMEAADKYNSSHIKIQKTQGDFMDLVFNPNSPKQLSLLLFDIMEYEPLDYTPTKQPKTNRATIEEFCEVEHDVIRREVLESLIAISQTGIILSTFLDTFVKLWYDVGTNDLRRLYGNQRLGGTQTGRLSSNSPNFANMPSGSKYGKAIKSCFVAPEGWLFFGSDYGALEDRVGADITGDENKRAEFLRGYDGHSLRAYAFFKEEIDEALGEELDPNDPTSINRIKTELPDIRAKSKSPSFAMAYGSGFLKVKALLKCTSAEAKIIFDRYHILYEGTGRYAERVISKAKNTGYTTGAFGLKLRTPGLRASDQTKVGSEGRSLVNMTIQSYGLLMNRAGIQFQKDIEECSMIDNVVIINQIHDALYGLVKATPENVAWVNEHLIPAMTKDYREGQVIKLEAELDIGLSWDKQTTIKNGASLEDIKQTLEDIYESKSAA